MAQTPESPEDQSQGSPDGSEAQTPAPKSAFPGCSTLILSLVILLMVSLAIVGLLLMVGVNLHDRFVLVFIIFAAVGAFMSPLARRLKPYLEKKDE